MIALIGLNYLAPIRRHNGTKKKNSELKPHGCKHDASSPSCLPGRAKIKTTLKLKAKVIQIAACSVPTGFGCFGSSFVLGSSFVSNEAAVVIKVHVR